MNVDHQAHLRLMELWAIQTRTDDLFHVNDERAVRGGPSSCGTREITRFSPIAEPHNSGEHRLVKVNRGIKCPRCRLTPKRTS